MGLDSLAIINPPFSIHVLLTAREHSREREAGDKNRDAGPLRRREAEMVMEIGVIAAELFDKRARDGVAKQIRCENLAVEFFAPEQPRQKTIETEIQQRVVNFRRMQGNVERSAESSCACGLVKVMAHGTSVGRP